MILANMTPAQHARAAAKNAREICHSQSIAAAVNGEGCRAIRFRVKAGKLEVCSIYPTASWRAVDCDETGRPLIYGDAGNQL